jgi:hypothetical protein
MATLLDSLTYYWKRKKKFKKKKKLLKSDTYSFPISYFSPLTPFAYVLPKKFSHSCFSPFAYISSKNLTTRHVSLSAFATSPMHSQYYFIFLRKTKKNWQEAIIFSPPTGWRDPTPNGWQRTHGRGWGSYPATHSWGRTPSHPHPGLQVGFW